MTDDTPARGPYTINRRKLLAAMATIPALGMLGSTRVFAQDTSTAAVKPAG